MGVRVCVCVCVYGWGGVIGFGKATVRCGAVFVMLFWMGLRGHGGGVVKSMESVVCMCVVAKLIFNVYCLFFGS